MNYQELSRDDLLIKIAELYYLEGLSQQEIANMIHTSRSNVARFLKMCVDEGVVEFKINKQSSTELEVQNVLERRFRLQKVMIVSSAGSPEQVKSRVGAATAEYLDSIVRDNCLIGLSWGTTLYQTVRHYNPQRIRRADVIQFVGGIGSKCIDTDGQDIVKRLQAHFDGTGYVLHAPMIVQNNVLKQMLMEQPDIKSHFEKFHKTDIAVIGIGSTRSNTSAAYRAGHISKQEADDMLRHGAIGDLCGTQIDVEGRICETALTGRVIGVPLETLLAIPVRIGCACGPDKTNPILGALRGGYVNVLVTDEETGRKLVEIT